MCEIALLVYIVVHSLYIHMAIDWLEGVCKSACVCVFMCMCALYEWLVFNQVGSSTATTVRLRVQMVTLCATASEAYIFYFIIRPFAGLLTRSRGRGRTICRTERLSSPRRSTGT